MLKINSLIRLSFVCVVLFMISCKPQTEKNVGFEIKGEIENLEDGIVKLSKLDLISNERIDVDSTIIIDGKFSITGEVESPYLHTLFFNNDMDKIHFFLENSAIKIVGDAKLIEEAKVSGSREDSLFRCYKVEDIFDRRKGMEIMLKNPGYSFAAFTAYYQFQVHNIQADTLELIINGFDESVKQSIYFKHLFKLYNTIKQVAISQAAPSFSIPDTNGKLVTLGDFKGKYVLIDFWASWCAPCRAVNPKLVEVHKQFSGKDFEIIGISIDKDEKSWKKAIETDRLPWINLSNLEGWDDVSATYGVKAVPQNFLLDPDGIIIDKNIEPEHLTEQLKKILTD